MEEASTSEVSPGAEVIIGNCTMSGNQIVKPLLHQTGHMFTKNGRSKQVNFTGEVVTGLVLGLGFGLVWKMYHWNEKRVIDEYYHTLAKIHKEEAAAKGVPKELADG